MRKRVIVICGVLVICIIGVIVISLLKSNEAEFNPMDNVTMEIVEGTLTNTGATIVIPIYLEKIILIVNGTKLIN